MEGFGKSGQQKGSLCWRAGGMVGGGGAPGHRQGPALSCSADFTVRIMGIYCKDFKHETDRI